MFSPETGLKKVRFWIFTLFLSLACCHGGRGASVTLPSGKRIKLPSHETLSTVLTSEPPKLDWLLSSDTDSSWIQEQIMEGLIRFDLTQPGLKLEPALATDWESKESGKVWVFHLRKNVQWTDGVELNASHFVDAVERILNPASAAIAVDNIFPIENAKEYNQGKVNEFSKVGVKAQDDYTLIFNLKEPMAFFPMLLTHHTYFPIRKDVIEKFGDLWTEPQNIVTLGPYKMIHWHHDSRLVLQKNENYWKGPAQIPFIVFYMIGKAATSLRMFERGKLDFIRDLPTSEIPRLSQKPEFKFLPGLRLYYYGFKVNKKPFNDKRVRKAIAYAIDRQEITQVMGGGQIPLSNWIPQGMFGFDDQIGLPFDPKKAKELMKEAGYPNPGKIKSVALGFNTEEKHRQVAENVQAQLKKNLGLKVELKNEEWKTFLNGLRSDSAYSIFRLGWVADYADPHNFMAIMTSFSVNNRTGWGSPEYDRLVQKGLKESDPKIRLKIYHRAQKILVEEEMPVIPLLADVNQLLVSQRIENFHNNVLDLYQFYSMRLKK